MRPVVYEGARLEQVLAAMRRYPSVVGTQRALAGTPSAGISPNTLKKLAARHGIRLNPQPGGRPFKFTEAQMTYVVELLNKHGVTKTIEILGGRRRDRTLFPEPITVTAPTLRKYRNLCT